MRMYGLRSGKNNINKFIARSYMYNSSKSKPVYKTPVYKTNDVPNTEQLSDAATFEVFWGIILICAVVILYCQ